MGRGTTLGVYLKAISSSGSLLLLLLLHFHDGIITGASAAFPSTQMGTEQKCDKVVQVETVELLSYLGNVTFTAPTPFKGRWTTVIKFTSPYTFIGGWGVVVQSFGRKGYAILERNKDVHINEGDKVIFQFRILYGRNVKIPKVLSIRWQNIPICGPPMMTGPYRQHMNYENTDPTAQEESTRAKNSSSLDVDIIQEHIVTNNVRIADAKNFTDGNE